MPRMQMCNVRSKRTCNTCLRHVCNAGRASNASLARRRGRSKQRIHFCPTHATPHAIQINTDRLRERKRHDTCYRPGPENVLVCRLFSAARCSLSGAGCTTLHRDQRLADRLRARRLVPAARCAALLRNKFSKLARLLNETIVRNLFPSLSTAARKRMCKSTTLRFLLDGSFCLISHDFNRDCICFRAFLEVIISKTRTALRTRHIGSVLRSVSGSCSTQCQRFAKVSKGAGWAGCSTLPAAESREPSCSALVLSKGLLPVHPATEGCSALHAAPASAAVCSVLLAGAPVWPSRLARSLLPSVMTACFNSVIKVANGRRRF